MIRWPNKIVAGTTNDEMVQNLDFAQTFLEAAQIPVPTDMQGESLIPLLMGKADQWKRDAVYYHYYEYPAVHQVKRHYGIVTKDFKLVHFYYDVEEWELYNRKGDPLEMKNVYNDPEYATIVKALKKKLEEMRVQYKDSRELDQKYIEMIKR
jgi:arylsulfatase A-like enzyme